jgi:hypothetical protein
MMSHQELQTEFAPIAGGAMKRIAFPAIVAGVCFLFGLPDPLGVWPSSEHVVVSERQTQESSTSPELETLRAEVKRLQDVVPDQAHAMMSVAYNFNNLWFAVRADNWELAQFYWGETRSHLRWAVRIIPVRKDSAKRDVDLRAILQAVENAPMKELAEAIKDKNRVKSEAAYKFMIESCYACHKAAEKGYLKLQLPERPAEPIINFDPKAEWPK